MQQMLSMPLNRGDLYESHTIYRLDLIHSTCSSNRQSELKAGRIQPLRLWGGRFQ